MPVTVPFNRTDRGHTCDRDISLYPATLSVNADVFPLRHP
jgi:hypothetical protein